MAHLFPSGCGDPATPGGDADAREDADAVADAQPEADGDEGAEAPPDVPPDAPGDGIADANDEVGEIPAEADVEPESDYATDAETLPDPGADIGPDSECDYLDLEIYLASCPSGYEHVRRFSDLGGDEATCPSYWVIDGDAYGSLASAIGAHGCDADCIYRPATAVMFLHCGHRDEFTEYRADGAGCPPVLEFSTGFYASLEEYEAANPCGADGG